MVSYEKVNPPLMPKKVSRYFVMAVLLTLTFGLTLISLPYAIAQMIYWAVK